MRLLLPAREAAKATENESIRQCLPFVDRAIDRRYSLGFGHPLEEILGGFLLYTGRGTRYYWGIYSNGPPPLCRARGKGSRQHFCEK